MTMAQIQDLRIVSFNMHGFNQGIETVLDLINCSARCPDVIFLQEHWLTPANLSRFDEKILTHFCFGKSAMSECVSQGPLRGRPYGGVMTLIKNDLRSVAECIYCTDRFVIVKVGDLVLANIYLPTVGTANRLEIIEDILHDIWSWRLKYSEFKFLIGGDFNTDLDKQQNAITNYINNFLSRSSLVRCDLNFSGHRKDTYINEALGSSSKIDYFVCQWDMIDEVDQYVVLDTGVNLSDHLPISIICKCIFLLRPVNNSPAANSKVKQLRWDKADLISYYRTTMTLLYPLYNELVDSEVAVSVLNPTEQQHFIDAYYQRIVDALNLSASQFVPAHFKNFYKFWWSEELTSLKEAAIESDRVWKVAGRPRSGSISDKRHADKRKYKRMLYKEQRAEKESYSNDLHDALMSKTRNNFWKCWKSKFDNNRRRRNVIDGLADDGQIAEAFADFFCRTCSSSNENQNSRLHGIYKFKRQNYVGDVLLDEHMIDVQLVESACSNMKRGKAAGLDELTLEHLLNSHPVLLAILAKFFNLIINFACVPYGFRLSYTVPLPKDENGVKCNSVENYRAISISPVISKIFEHCILIRYSEYFTTSPNQFGFKRAHGCGHAIYSMRKVVDHYIAGGSTVNVCQLDLSKAFDKMNHFGLYIKLMAKSLPVQILSVLESWFSMYLSCVKWGSQFSYFYQLKTGVRQGGVLSPFLFAIFVDVLTDVVDKADIGCRVGSICTAIFMYADDIILLAPSVCALQSLVKLCENEINLLDMSINIRKSCCLRFGPRYKSLCTRIACNGEEIEWVSMSRYLGVYLVASFHFKCSFDQNKAGFYRAFNAIYGKLGSNVSEEVLFALIESKCLPILYYGLDVCPTNSSDRQSLEFSLSRVLFKIFGPLSKDSKTELMKNFGLYTVNELVNIRRERFICRYRGIDNLLCQVIFHRCI